MKLESGIFPLALRSRNNDWTTHFAVLVTTWSVGAFRFAFKPTSHRITARINPIAFRRTAAIAGFSFVDNSVSARPEISDLIGLVK